MSLIFSTLNDQMIISHPYQNCTGLVVDAIPATNFPLLPIFGGTAMFPATDKDETSQCMTVHFWATYIKLTTTITAYSPGAYIAA